MAIKRFFTVSRYFGFIEALRDIGTRILIARKNNIRTYQSIGLKHPVCIRPFTPDNKVYNAIYRRNEYAPFAGLKNIHTIIDLGAYTGLSTLWFLNSFPGASIIAVEPDPENLAVLKINISPYGKRVAMLNAAVWPRKTGLRLNRGTAWWGAAWSTRVVEECREGAHADIQGIDMENLMEISGFETVDILKIDIEGSELRLFSEGHEKWLHKVKNIGIELHDEDCKRAFFAALSGFNYELSASGELTVCKNIKRK